MFRKIRIAALLGVLFIVAMNAWLDKVHSRDWERTLRVVIYPINGDLSPSTEKYVNNLTRENFTPLEAFFSTQGQLYDIKLRSLIDVRLAPQIKGLPPALPKNSNILDTMLWSLKLRYWVFSVDDYQGPTPEVRIFVLFFDPETHPRLPHSVGLEKGLIGVVQAYAGRKFMSKNNVVIAHELLHTVGATDKYNPADNLPLFPIGYADPDRQPLYPQSMAEIMGGRIPISETQAVIPKSLVQAMIGPQTALEINWIDPDDNRLD